MFEKSHIRCTAKSENSCGITSTLLYFSIHLLFSAHVKRNIIQVAPLKIIKMYNWQTKVEN